MCVIVSSIPSCDKPMSAPIAFEGHRIPMLRPADFGVDLRAAQRDAPVRDPRCRSATPAGSWATRQRL